MSKEIFVLSDIHLGKGLTYDWYKQDKHEAQLLALFDTIITKANKSRVDVVLAGDVFDTWQCAMDETPPTIEEILAFNTKVIEKLKLLLSKVENVFYINGNHDMHVSEDDLAMITSEGKKLQHVKAYRSGLLKIEHGHKYTMFNAQDKLHDPLHGLPLGYFITRILSKDSRYTSPCAIASYIDDLLEAAITTQSISSSLIEALSEYMGKNNEDEITMPFGRKNVTIGMIKARYAKLFELWVQKFGYMYTINSIRAEIDSLNWFADKLSKKHDYRVVVFGHTHYEEIDEDKLFLRHNRIYANSGCWIKDNPSYVHITKKSGQYITRLMQKEGDEFILKEQKVTD